MSTYTYVNLRKKPEKWEKHKFIRINERVAKHKEDLPFALNLFQHICKFKQNVHGFDRRQRVDVQAFQAV